MEQAEKLSELCKPGLTYFAWGLLHTTTNDNRGQFWEGYMDGTARPK